MPHVNTNGINLYYEEQGSGDPVLLIMGITAPGAVWEAHANDWSQEFRCIKGDNRGVGLSDKPAGPYSSEMMADDYAGLIDSLGLENVRVVGCSMGSIIAQQLALRHPEKIRSLVLMCPWARTDSYAKSVFKHMADCKKRLTPDEFMEWIQLLIFTKPFWDNPETGPGLADGRRDAYFNPAPQPIHALEGQAAACVNHDTFEKLGSIDKPTLVIGGKNDIFTPPWMANEVASGIPGAELHLYDNAGHAFHWEQLGDFNPRVRAWLRAH